MSKNLWELESDIFTNYEGTIVEAQFKFNEYGGQAAFTVEVDGRDPDKPTWENFNLPPGWESNDGGETIERTDGAEKGITKGSQWGRFLQAVAGCEGAREEVGDDAPVNALAWVGTKWRWEVTEAGKGRAYKLTDKDTGEKKEGVTKDKNYPVEFLGKEFSADTTPADRNGSGAVDSLSVLTDLRDPLLQQEIVEAATKMGYSEWFQYSYQVIQKSGVPMNELADLLAAMGQPKLYESLGGKG